MPLGTESQFSVEDFYVTFRRDLAAFKAMLPNLLNEYPDQYVAILNGQVVAHHAQWEHLADVTRREYPDKFVLLERVVLKAKQVVDMDTIEG